MIKRFNKTGLFFKLSSSPKHYKTFPSKTQRKTLKEP